MKQFSKVVSQISVGNGLSEEVSQGPMINTRAIQKTLELVDDAVKKGAKVVVGGGVHPKLGGNFFEPTVITDVSPDMEVCNTEIFGPLAPIQKFETEEEVIHLANNTRAGLIFKSLSLPFFSLFPSLLSLFLSLSSFSLSLSLFVLSFSLSLSLSLSSFFAHKFLFDGRFDGICVHSRPWEGLENGGSTRIRDGWCQ